MKSERTHQREYARRRRDKLSAEEREERRLKQRAYCREWWRQRDRRVEKAAYNRDWQKRLRDEDAMVNEAIVNLKSDFPDRETIRANKRIELRQERRFQRRDRCSEAHR